MAIVTPPVGVLDLDIHTTLETDPSRDPSSPVHALAAPITSPFLCLDSSEPSGDFSDSDSPDSLSPPDSHETIIPEPSGIPRRHAILVLPSQEIPFGRSYHTHPDGARMLLTARKRVHPFLARILANRRRFHSSSSVPPRKRRRASPYSSSSATHSSSPVSVGPSRKRCRSPTADSLLLASIY
ncbi:hypothetical protein Tco_0377129 [Tanacetum coccineum]